MIDRVAGSRETVTIEERLGFRNDRSSTVVVFVVRQVLEQMEETKRVGNGGFVNLEKV